MCCLARQLHNNAGGGDSMRLQPASVVMLTVVAVVAPSAALSAVQAPNSSNKAQNGKKAASGTSLTGCVDEREGHYMIVDDRNLDPVADLVADGFPTEGFAKHVGHKVTVRGISSSGSTRPVFTVRSIETVSETCAPTPQSDKK
jgi:hypothetical protein